MKRLGLLALSLAACHDTIVVGGLQEVAAVRSIPNRDLDLLFVIDNSASTGDKQAALAAAFPRMMDVLSQIDGGLPNLHIGVVTTDMGTSSSGDALPAPAIGQLGAGGCAGRGDDGALKRTPTMTEAFLSDVEGPGGTRVRNYSGTLREVFGELAHVGYTGCGIEQPLAAMKRALGNPANAGFLRDGANLAIVILADEDDCSLATGALLGPDSQNLGPLDSFRCFRFGVECAEDTNTIGPKTGCMAATASPYVDDLNPFVDAILAAKSDARMVMTAAIVGDPTPVAVELRQPPGGGTPAPALAHSCTFDSPAGVAVADPGVRLAGLLESFPGRSALTSICSADLTNPMQLIGDSAKKLMGDTCLDTTTLADVSPTDDGVQPSCEVADIRDSAPGAVTMLPLCSSGAPDCYELVADAAVCPATADHLRVKIHRSATVPEDSWTYIRCQLAP
ncbi:MAG: VWA domain-containing protein [Myxococcales bacterium]|nr:VWA domain-containing protein [Myxococcales bacterium]